MESRSVLGQTLQHRHDLHPGGEVEKRERLVQHDEFGVLRQCFGDHYFLPLSVADARLGPLGQRGDPDRPHRLFDFLPVLRVQAQ